VFLRSQRFAAAMMRRWRRLRISRISHHRAET